MRPSANSFCWVSFTLAASSWVGLGGSALVVWLATRYGRLWPLALAILLTFNRAAIADIPRIEAIMQRVVELDENYYHAGARMALLNRGYRREIEDTVSHIEKIETALEPKFQEHFVYAMALPNKVDPFPKLSAAVKLPPRKTVSEDGVETLHRGEGHRRGHAEFSEEVGGGGHSGGGWFAEGGGQRGGEAGFEFLKKRHKKCG